MKEQPQARGLRYVGRELFLNETPLSRLAKKFPTPFYCYDLGIIRSQVRLHKKAFCGPVEIHFAMKANNNIDVLKCLRREGVGVDTVSGGEIQRALQAGFHPKDIIFSGVGKSEDELRLAIRQGIKLVNVESLGELERIAKLFRKMKTNVPLGFRFNPDVSAETHPYITTGFRENKFGMDKSFLSALRAMTQKWGVEWSGVSLHIGSQLKSLKALDEAIGKTLPIAKMMRAEGHSLEFFDVGGGVAIDYFEDSKPVQSLAGYGRLVEKHLKGEGFRILCEPGRVLVGPAGVLVTRVEYIKETNHKKFIIVDTGMHHLLRPALYSAFHRILTLKKSSRLEKVDVVGPICESSDFLARDRMVPRLDAGEFLCVGEAGAYGFTMASQYNLRALPTEVVLDGKRIQKSAVKSRI